jgi:hypothetical protein
VEAKAGRSARAGTLRANETIPWFVRGGMVSGDGALGKHRQALVADLGEAA